MSHIWTTLTRGDRDFEADINKRSVVGARAHLSSAKVLFNKIGTTVTTSRPYYTERIDGLTGQFQETAEGTQEAPPMNPIQVADIKLRVKYYTAALVLSKNRVEDDGLGLIQKLTPKIPERAYERMEIDFQNMVLNNPTTFDPVRDQRDGVALASTAHPAGPYGETWGNTFATPQALSESSLGTAITSFMSIRDDNGDVAPLMPKKFVLIVHPTKLLFAQQLVKSLSSLADSKNSGVINPVSSANGFSFEVYPALYQQNTNAWTLVAVDDTEDGGLLVVVRKQPGAPRKIIRDNPDQIQFMCDMRYAMGVSNPRNIFFSGNF